jgi:uncharacterized FlaG/YvyC family protein
MDIRRIERMVGMHMPTRQACVDPGSKEGKAGPQPDAAARARERDGLSKPEDTSFPVDETSVRFSYDKEIGRIVMQVLDTESATVVKQLPSEEVVAFLKRFRKTIALLVDTTA